jgi:hypothetical protein
MPPQVIHLLSGAATQLLLLLLLLGCCVMRLLQASLILSLVTGLLRATQHS